MHLTGYPPQLNPCYVGQTNKIRSMIRGIQTLLTLLAGIAIGVLAVVALAFRAVDGAAILLAAELEDRATRSAEAAWCRKDYARGSLHGWMQLQLSPGIRPVEFGGFPRTVHSLVALSKLAAAVAPANNPRADYQMLAFQRARLAVMLERAGLSELADEQWNQAERVFSEDGHSVERERFANMNDQRCPRPAGVPNSR